MLVTGAGGFLGGAVVRRLASDGTPVRAQVRRPPAAGTAPVGTDDVVTANLLSPDSLPPLVDGVDVVVHAAAGMRGAAADRYRSTVVGTRNLFDALAGTAVRRVVLIGSVAVYRTRDLPTGAAVDESTPLEPHPARRGAYVQAKSDQEAVARERAEALGIELVVLRPGVIHGPGGTGLSDRVGLQVGPVLVVLGASATLPLTFVENCADAVAVACAADEAAGATVNVVDDDLPTGAEYLRARRAAMGPVRSVPLPYPALLRASGLLERYHRWSRGQLPAVLDPYAVASRYRDFRWPNTALQALGWTQRVPTAEAMAQTFAAAA